MAVNGAPWFSQVGALLVGWVLLPAVGVILTRWYVSRRRDRGVLWAYLVVCGAGATWGTHSVIGGVLSGGGTAPGFADLVLLYVALAVFWPFILCWILAGLVLWEGHG
jgi:hypothetical protein